MVESAANRLMTIQPLEALTSALPIEFSLDEITYTCPSCYQPLESARELDLNTNPRQLCVDCLEAEEALYNWEVA